MLEASVKQWIVGPAETTFGPSRLYPDQSKQELGRTWGPDEAHVDDHRGRRRAGQLQMVPGTVRGQPATLPAHDYFVQILDSDGTVLLCLHEWGAHEHPSLMSSDHGTPGNGLLLFF